MRSTHEPGRFAALLPLHEARARILSLKLREPPRERVPVWEAAGRIAAEALAAPGNVPGEPLAAMDGYAVRSRDAARPGARLRLLPRGSARLPEGAAVEVETGEPLPEGADAVVRKEATRVEGGWVVATAPVRPWENVFKPGEFVERGAVLVERGDLVSPGAAGLLAQAGVQSLEVYKVRVSVIIAGRGVEPGWSYSGRARDSVSPVVAGWVRGWAEPRVLGPVSPERLAGAINDALDYSDAVVVVGRASVGRGDSAKRIVAELGGEIVVPGYGANVVKRSGLAALEGKPVSFLPGQCVGAAVGLHETLLRAMKGLTGKPLVREALLTLANPVEVKRRMPTTILLRLGPSGAEPLEWGVGLCRELARADAYAILNPGSYPSGSAVEATLLGPRTA